MTELQTTWGWLVAVDLFLGGLGAGIFCTVAVVSLVRGERFKSTVRFCAWASAVAIGFGALFLLLDAGKPLRALVLFRSFVNFQSWMTIGAWLVLGAMLLSGLFALLWTDPVLRWLERVWHPLWRKRVLARNVLAGIGIPVTLGVAIYTGMLLGSLPFRPFWHTWLLPTLFTASALCAGSAFVAGFAVARERAEGVERLLAALGILLVVMIVVQGAIWAFRLPTAIGGSPDVARSAQVLTGGPLGLVFWIVVVALGLALPLILTVIQLVQLVRRTRPAPVLRLVAIPSVLVGAFVMRWLVLAAGLPQTLSSPVLQQIVEGIRFVP